MSKPTFEVVSATVPVYNITTLNPAPLGVVVAQELVAIDLRPLETKN